MHLIRPHIFVPLQSPSYLPSVKASTLGLPTATGMPTEHSACTRTHVQGHIGKTRQDRTVLPLVKQPRAGVDGLPLVVRQPISNLVAPPKSKDSMCTFRTFLPSIKIGTVASLQYIVAANAVRMCIADPCLLFVSCASQRPASARLTHLLRLSKLGPMIITAINPQPRFKAKPE